jgi:hypothetical protein
MDKSRKSWGYRGGDLTNVMRLSQTVMRNLKGKHAQKKDVVFDPLPWREVQLTAHERAAIERAHGVRA